MRSYNNPERSKRENAKKRKPVAPGRKGSLPRRGGRKVAVTKDDR